MSQDLGYPPSWGRAGLLPAYGGAAANLAWQKLGVTSRANVGGFPCEIVHGGLGSRWGLGNGCTVNAAIRLALAFFEAVAIYLPVRYTGFLQWRFDLIFFPSSFLSGPLCSHYPYTSQIHFTSATRCFTDHSARLQERRIFIHICVLMLVWRLLHAFNLLCATIPVDFA